MSVRVTGKCHSLLHLDILFTIVFNTNNHLSQTSQCPSQAVLTVQLCVPTVTDFCPAACVGNIFLSGWQKLWDRGTHRERRFDPPPLYPPPPTYTVEILVPRRVTGRLGKCNTYGGFGWARNCYKHLKVEIQDGCKRL